MPGLIQKSGYIKPGNGGGHYAEYIATREGVELIEAPPPSHDGGGYLEYMAERPRSHGLFSADGPADLENTMEEINGHTGPVWTFVYSLKREDAHRLGYENSDLVGWISIPGTRIDYPVMQTKDNPNFYLKHAFDKSYSSYGVPYMQENCDVGISDNLVLYGHHMNNGSMFSDLCKYESEDFYQEHKTIRFDTLDSFGDYEVIAAFKTVAYSEEGFKYYHFVRAEQEEDFDEFIAKCKELALYDTGVTAEYGDQLITLSTCEYSRTNGRMVVVAKLLEE